MSSRRERIATVATRTHLDRLYRTRARWHGIVILNYHRLGDPATSSLDRNVFSGTQDQFDRQLALIARHADLLDPADLADAIATPDRRHQRYVVITFDDGYRDNHDLALPVLQRHGVHAAFFIASGFIDRPHLPWYDEIAWMLRGSPAEVITLAPWLPDRLLLTPEHRETTIGRVAGVYPTLREDPARTTAYLDAIGHATGTGRAPADTATDLWMTWDRIRALRDAGMTIGGHTVTHPALADLPPDRQRQEIVDNRARIVAETGTQPDLFAYPFGGRHQFTDETGRILAESRYRLGLSFYGGYNPPIRQEPWDVRRLYMSHTTTDAALTGLLTLPQLFAIAPPARTRST